MKFSITREQLLAPLQQIVNVIEKRQTMPVLSNVLLVLEDSYLTLTGTDLEIQVIAQVEIETPGNFEITVPARKLFDICRSFPGESKINIELVGDQVRVVCGRSRFSLSTLPAEEYPEFSEHGFEHRFIINAGMLKKALDKTIFCMAVQDVRYYLNGLMLNISNSKLKIVASDGHRLSVFEDDLSEPTGFQAQIIIPRKGVVELSRLLSDSEANISVEFSDNNIRIKFGGLVFSAKLVDSKYPDFNRVFNQEFKTPLNVQKQTLRDALARVSILASEKHRGLSFDVDKDLIKISAHNPEHEEAEEEVVIDYSGEPFSIAFNGQYLLDAISNVDSELAVLKIASNLSSCIIEESEAQNYKFIVMPMRI